MSSIKYRWLAVIAAAAGIVGWLGNYWAVRNSLPAPVLSVYGLLAVLLISGATLILGLRVRRWQQGNRNRELDPIAAARTLVLAQATAYAGSLLLGWHAGIFLEQVPLWSLRPGHSATWSSLAMIAGGVLMISVGLLVERFCRLPPPDDSNGHGGTAAGPDTRREPGDGEYA
ncbi:DUF3180 domain-containing protein [Arthrobacter sp. zg-Y820]|uniref:DUF3180 domain-containing protein n=1 Tax=unclassified Arthrobacter TaxID=235627 RepID=UPI002540E796|nr:MULTISPECIES: DUF3180 domain-containing protein [unclassified Arthrobacter]MCC9197454.1 DUF3180 domain-containing protein [Arthrobacter sp. zg-Y820]MDK1280321.1 DUF3180 domain-containing protein [Arthrobacter sp. zg.Y820]WIB09607.1 DUF3180 domain-containing protein [Arthrobacter sp. zg-Y820]